MNNSMKDTKLSTQRKNFLLKKYMQLILMLSFHKEIIA